LELKLETFNVEHTNKRVKSKGKEAREKKAKLVKTSLLYLEDKVLKDEFSALQEPVNKFQTRYDPG